MKVLGSADMYITGPRGMVDMCSGYSTVYASTDTNECMAGLRGQIARWLRNLGAGVHVEVTRDGR